MGKKPAGHLVPLLCGGLSRNGSIESQEWHYAEVWSCWRKCIAVGVDFEVSYAQATLNMGCSLLLPADQDVELPVPSL